MTTHTREQTKVGFIGLGIMGSRMAANLQKRGVPLFVFNRTRKKADALIANGAKWAESPGTMGRQVDVLFTMLAYPANVRETALGQDGFLAQMKPGQTWIDCSTVNPSFSREMAAAAEARGVHYLDAPVTGSKEPAAEAKLVIWAGGPAEGLEACRPLLQCIGSKIVHCGGNGMGTAMKMVMNQLMGTMMGAFAEGMVLGESLGLTRKALLEAILSGNFAAPFLAAKRGRIESGNYAPADFPLRWQQKDLHLAALSAEETGAALPLTNAAKEIYRLAIRDGHGDEDFSGIHGYLAQNQDVTQ